MGFLQGKKTYIAAVGLMLSGLGAVIAGFVQEGGPDYAAVKAGALVFFNGLGFFGVKSAMVNAALDEGTWKK